MKNKGYTLIELLAVIIILALLITLVFPSIINFIKSSNDKKDNITRDLVYNAAEMFIEDNSNEYYSNNGSKYCISIDTLIENNYLKGELEYQGETLDSTKSVRVTYTDKFNYEITNTNTCMVMEPGLYDEKDNLIANWQTLVDAGLNTEDLSNVKQILETFEGPYKFVIGEGVTSIGYDVFYNCSELTSVTIPESVTFIDDYAFEGCTGLTSIIIPSSVTSIGEGAFLGCTGLSSITISEGVTSIGDYAFNECSGLTSITIPSSVTSIGEEVFIMCAKLSSIVVDKNNSVYDSRGDSNAIIETATNTLIVGCKNTVIPSSVTSIGSYAFSDCTGLTSITIPEGVTSIGWGTFYECSGLTSITISNSVTSIGDYAFNGCSGLTSITLGSGVTSIGSYVFKGCSSLTSITIPSSVTSIGWGTFSGCSSLTSIKVDSNNSTYDSRDNSNAIIETATNTLIAGCKNTVIPNSVTTISSGAFSGCTGLSSITIPDSVTSIGYNIFLNCSNLKTIYYSGTATGAPWGATNATIIAE